MTPYTRELQPGDVEHVARTMRPEDQEEVRLSSGRSPLEALKHAEAVCLYLRTMDVNGEPLGIYGVTRVPGSEIGYTVFALLSTAIRDHEFKLARHTKAAIRQIFLDHPKAGFLANQVFVKNTVHLSWLRWAGAHLAGPSLPYGANGAFFRPFYIPRPSDV